jgi:hypothetical protein
MTTPIKPSNQDKPDKPDFDLDADMELDMPTGMVAWQELYPTLERKPLRLSYSTFNLLHQCPRKFNLLKLKNINNVIEYEKTKDTDYGSAFGVGIQEYILTNDIEQAIWKAMLEYQYVEETKNKNAVGVILGIQAFAAQWDPTEWEVAYYKGKPACELSFKIILDEATQDYYCGYVDVVLINKRTKVAVIVEIKTTGLNRDDIKPYYQNSSQAVGYSIVLDAIVGAAEASSWTILYVVNQLKSYTNPRPKLQSLPFYKSKKDRLEWLLDTRIAYDHLLGYLSLDYWPKEGGACMDYNRACSLFNLCDLTTLATHEQLIKPEDDWTFVFTLDELIAMNYDAQDAMVTHIDGHKIEE